MNAKREFANKNKRGFDRYHVGLTSITTTMSFTMAFPNQPEPIAPAGAATDDVLVEAARRGEREAFERLVRENAHWVRSVVFGVLGHGEQLDDVCQQVWTSVWLRLPKLRDSSRWRPWLYRTARNRATDSGRRRGREPKLLAWNSTIRDPAGFPKSGGDALVHAEKQKAVLGAIGALPAKYREPFVLRHVEGWSYRQIGEVMNLPVDTVETRLVRARRLLRETLRDKV